MNEGCFSVSTIYCLNGTSMIMEHQERLLYLHAGYEQFLSFVRPFHLVDRSMVCAL